LNYLRYALRPLLILVDRLCSDRYKIYNIVNAPKVSKIGFQIGEFKGLGHLGGYRFPSFASRTRLGGSLLT
jgi:hypothetical protein